MLVEWLRNFTVERRTLFISFFREKISNQRCSTLASRLARLDLGFGDK